MGLLVLYLVNSVTNLLFLEILLYPLLELFPWLKPFKRLFLKYIKIFG